MVKYKLGLIPFTLIGVVSYGKLWVKIVAPVNFRKTLPRH